jgi:hypothetical protein
MRHLLLEVMNYLEENEIVEGAEEKLLGQSSMQEPFQVFDGVTMHRVSPTCALSARVGMAVGMREQNEIVLLGHSKNFAGDSIYGYVISVDRENLEIQVKKRGR